MDIDRARRRCNIALATALVAPGALCASVSDSAARALRIVTAEDSEATRDIARQLLAALPGARLSGDDSEIRAKSAICIAIGPLALVRCLHAEHESTVLSTFTSSQVFRGIIDGAPKARARLATALYAEPSPHQQMRLIAHLFKRRITVAVLLSDRSSYLAPALQQAASAAGLDLQTELTTSSGRLMHHLDRALAAQALLAVPDPALYNRDTVRDVLMAAYRRNRPVIGYSASLVKAGAIASVTSSVAELVQQTAETVDELASTGRVPAPVFPKYFHTLINDDVARSLSIPIDESVRALARVPGSPSA